MAKTELPESVTSAIARHRSARQRADAAFVRYFERRTSGERTNGAAWQRLENAANEAWTSAHNAICAVARSNEDVWLHSDAEDYL